MLRRSHTGKRGKVEMDSERVGGKVCSEGVIRRQLNENSGPIKMAFIS